MRKLLPVFILIMLFAVSGCIGKKQAESGKQELSVKVFTAEKKKMPDFYETSGVVKSKNSAEIAAKIMAKVVALNFNEGDVVKKGQLLVKLDNTDLSARVNSAQAASSEAHRNLSIAREAKKLSEITYQRYKNIYEENAISQQELDEITAKRNISNMEYKRASESLNRANAGLAEAQTFLGYSSIYAPISGVIAEKAVDLGDTAMPGQKLFSIKDNNLEIESQVDESLINKVQTGTPVKIKTESGELFQSAVIKAVNSIDTASRTFKVKIKADSQDFKDGQFVKVVFPIGESEKIAIPSHTVIKKGELEGVYIVNNEGLTSFRLVKTGKEAGNMVEIISGIEPGTKIIADNLNLIEDGVRCRIQE